MSSRIASENIRHDNPRSGAIELLQHLIAAQRGGERAVQRLIAERLKAAGCRVEHLDYVPAEIELHEEFAQIGDTARSERTAVTGVLEGNANYQSLLLFAHPDSEPLPETTGWRNDPLKSEILDGRIYGWGIADDLAGCAAAILALESLTAQPGKHGQVIFCSTPSKHHARGVAAVLHRSDMTADASLYLHPAESGAGMNEIKALASGQLEFKITITGQRPATTEPGHAAFAHKGFNPIDLARKLMSGLESLAQSRAERVKHERLEEAVGRSTNLMISAVHSSDSGSFSRMPAACWFSGAVSFPPGEALSKVQSEIEQSIHHCAQHDPWMRDNPPVIEWLSGVTGAEVKNDHPFYRVTSSAVRRVTGKEPFVNPMHTSSDIRNPAVQKNIPTLGLGCLCGDLTQNQKTDEWVDLDDFLRMVEATAAIARDWCGNPRAVKA